MHDGAEKREPGAVARWGLLVVVLVYMIAATAILIRAKGLPFGLDGNESFSDAIHARNLYDYGWAKSYGLTDESYGVTAASHPFIHSHQGNFPRLYIFCLYFLGARSVEAQVILTVFTIGLAGVVMAFLFFSRIVNPLFGIVVCLVYVSDYFLFGQWDLNTYRVWHSFFFFSSLLCVLAHSERPTRATALLTLLNFACLCYWEFVFTFFVLILSAICAIMIGWRHPRRVLAIWGLEMAGCICATATLIGQLVAYMGMEAVLKDISYTFHARNSSENQSFTKEITEFYARHKVLFWPNYVDASHLRNLRELVASLLRRQLEHYTPVLGLAMVFTAAGWLLALLSARFLRRTPFVRGILFTVTLLAAQWWFANHWGWFDMEESSFWKASGWTSGWLVWVVPVGVVGIIALQIALGTDRVVGEGRALPIWTILGLFLAGIVAYIATYAVFTGYVFSGYLNRQAPLLVFLSDGLLALVVYTFAAPLAALGSASRPLGENSGSRIRIAGIALATICIGVLLLFSVGWLRLQREYLRAVPIDRYSFISRLAKSPYRGHSFVVNTYAAPVAVETGSWAYLEPVFYVGNVTLTAHGFEIEREATYKWFADLESNRAYEFPDYALIICQSDWGSDFRRYSELQGNTGTQIGPIETYSLFRRAASDYYSYLRDRVVDTDFKSDQGRFAIIKLDWDYPSYLRPLPPSESLASEKSFGNDQRWLVMVETLPGKKSDGIGPGIMAISTERESVDLLNATERDSGWEAIMPAQNGAAPELRARAGREAWVQATVAGEELHIDFRASPNAGRVRVRVNDQEGEVDLDAAHPCVKTAHFSIYQPEGELTSRATAVPGQYVGLRRNKDILEVTYLAAQQENVPEENTRLDLINRDDFGVVKIAETIELSGRDGLPVNLFEFRKENPETITEHARIARLGDKRDYAQWMGDFLSEKRNERIRPGILGGGEFHPSGGPPEYPVLRHICIPLPPDLSGAVYALVRPGTRTKLGPIYPSNTVEIPDMNAVYGAVRFRFRLPLDRPNGTERLLTCGTPSEGNLIFVEYLDGAVRLGFSDGRRIKWRSDPLSIDPSTQHVIEVSSGAMYPSVLSPAVPSSAAAFLPELTKQLWIRVDGTIVLSVPYSGSSVPWRTVHAGASSIDLFGFPHLFSGELTDVERYWPDASEVLPLKRQAAVTRFGSLKLKVLLPTGRSGGSEPLVTTGETGAGDFVYVVYLDPQHIKFGFDHWGVRGFGSDPMALDFSKPHDVEISIGSLFPADGDILFGNLEETAVEALKERVLVKLDGATVIDAVSNCYESPPDLVTIGRNEIGGSTTGPAFTGKILMQSRSLIMKPD